MIATCAWSFDPNGTLRDLMGDLPLLFAVIGLPALITTRRRAWTGLALAAAFLSLRLGLNLLRLSTILGLGAPLLQQARFTHPYVYTHPNAACMLAGLSLFVYAALLLRKNAWHHARFLFPLLGAALSALYLFVLASRGPQATIGLLALLAPLLLLPGWRPRLLALLLCTTTAAALWQLKDHINPRFADATMQGFNNRAIVWQHVSFLPRTQHRQWQGFGFGKRAFHKAYYENPHQRPPWVPGDTLRFPHAHSYWLMIRFEGGWIALALWSLAWLALLLRVIRTIRRDARATQPQHFLPLLRARLLPSLPALALAAILLYGLWDYPDSFLRDVQFLLLSLLAALTALPPQEILHEN